MIPVTFAAVPTILTGIGSRIPAIAAITLQALAMHPAATGRVVLTAQRLCFADLAVFFDGRHHDRAAALMLWERARAIADI